MIVLYTDFGNEGPYLGQIYSVLVQHAGSVPIINLFANAPSFNPVASAYLLAAYCNDFPVNTVFLCVVDPGVGGNRKPVMVEVDGRYFVGPDNGLFNVISMRGSEVKWWEITWQPEKMSDSFHGRDLFAPVVAQIAVGKYPQTRELDAESSIDRSWDKDYPAIIYIDHFGNAISGITVSENHLKRHISVNNHILSYARTFSEAAPGECFWYKNANGLLEIASNQANASNQLNINVGHKIQWQ